MAYITEVNNVDWAFAPQLMKNQVADYDEAAAAAIVLNVARVSLSLRYLGCDNWCRIVSARGYDHAFADVTGKILVFQIKRQ